MQKADRLISCRLDEGDPLRVLLEGTAAQTGERFFEVLVESLAKALHTKCALVTEYLEDQRRLNALALWVDGKYIPDFSLSIDNTPCQAVIDHSRLVHYPDNIRELFPDSAKLKEWNAVSYLGVPLVDLDGVTLGHLAVIDDQPMPQEPKNVTLFHIFADRAAAELSRMRVALAAKADSEHLKLLIQSAMDGIIELDQDFNVVMLNPAAGRILGMLPKIGIGRNFLKVLNPADRRKLKDIVSNIDKMPPGAKYLWVPGGLRIQSAAGSPRSVEATLTQLEMQRRIYYTLIIRDINERMEAERKIRRLKEQTDYLKAEIRRLDNFDEIIGESASIRDLMHSAVQVASTDVAVLILGETGTGKELIAHAIHRASRRADKPLIKVNCAALPPNLVESELFGHEAGAFTSAQRQHKGRFELADGGTIFMDEIGDMPLDVQTKLLRVLQEGCVERVGGTHPIRVDVRLIAATHRDLNEEISAGRFRADLFYRIHVYPMTIPPLRERREDIPALVNYFLARIGRRLGKVITQIPQQTMTALMVYDWPGNVRELRNVVERAMITSSGSELILPEPLAGRHPPQDLPAEKDGFESLDQVEKAYVIHVLQAKKWRISGPKGAAKILGLNPSTLRYRIKKLGINTPE